MDRNELAKAAAMALLDHDAAPVVAGGMNYSANFNTYWARAVAVLDAILPQVATVEELEALPVSTILVSAGGTIITRAAGPLDREKLAIRAAVALLPLTVVWRPS